jgi:hypothetical protein
MKLLFTIILFVFAASSYAQQVDTIRLKNKAGEYSGKIVTDRPPQAAYFGIGGAGLIFSANYDTRFSKRLNGVGAAIGVGSWFGGGVTVFTIPLTLNYLVGKKDHFLELGVGGTFVTGSVDFFNSSESGSGFLGHAVLGYRYQPAKGGFFARAGFTPLYGYGEVAMFYHAGFGYAF